MKQGRIIGIALIAILLIGVIAYYTKKALTRKEGVLIRRAAPILGDSILEGFQSTTSLKDKFWNYVDKLEDLETATLVEKVMYPSDTDIFRVEFPRYVAIYALVRNSDDPIAARKNLIDSYGAVMTEMNLVISDPARNASWSQDPKEQTCVELSLLREKLMKQIADMRGGVQDISANILQLQAVRGENLEYQKKLAKECKANMTESCKALASLDTTIYPLLAPYDTVNANLFENELSLQEIITIVNLMLPLIDCSKAGVTSKDKIPFTDVEKSIGYLDVDMLRVKLKELSPYYLSPVITDYLLSTVVRPQPVMTAIESTKQNLKGIKSGVSTLKKFTGTPS